ncbi:ECF RNA polymerase sigma factor SigK [Streptomyces sp. MI02-7b]|uniref:ECF RNA polymerase sigma factor SigK n=1 Tax=Streptomyces sp. MI02-7b TaxID=462941 RepID=UPI0029B86BFE|nr:ECF RNA polymerase sigma factor SigK [Streptomyces sp. MI02-7b]MDX3076967.1 ECF RNA polymerase sigma factor SigK [Streptomyces sp. MI02-7b]
MHVAAHGEDAAAPGQGALEKLLDRIANGDHEAFETLYTATAGAVLGLVRSLLRDAAQSEEVAQEVLIEVWRSASRYDPGKGSAMAWVMMLAHRRAVDRIRSVQKTVERDHKAAVRDHETPFDVVAEHVERRLERQQVRRCLDQLTDLQRQSVTMAYYRGYTLQETAHLLRAPLGTVKTRLRDGLIRLRDCLGVTA